MNAQLDPHRHLFIVRMWLETSRSPDGQNFAAPAGKQEQWRGLVESVTTGQRMYFTSLADMSDFISFQLEEK